ncbi:MAG: acetyltransferase [Rhodospirillales bacterium]
MSGGLPVIIIGAGGHGKVVAGLLQAAGAKVIGLTDNDTALHGGEVLGYPVLGGDSVIDGHAPDMVELTVGVGSTAPGSSRKKIYDGFAARGYRFRTCIHPAAWVSADAELGDGTQVMAGAVIQPGCAIGENAIINTRASIDHDCHIGAHAHIAPGAVLGGEVSVGVSTHVGIGATVIEDLTIGAGAMIAAGACVVADVGDGTCVAGVPAREMRRV